MPIEKNQLLARRYFEEFWNQADLDLADELFAVDITIHDPGTPGRQNGIEGEKQAVRLYRSAFPDLTFTIEEVVADGDTVVVRWSTRGTHLGELLGIPPTGRQGSPTGISLFRVAGGRFVEHWVNWDTMGLMQQLGVIPQLA